MAGDSALLPSVVPGSLDDQKVVQREPGRFSDFPQTAGQVRNRLGLPGNQSAAFHADAGSGP